jgi:hypothetical protein
MGAVNIIVIVESVRSLISQEDDNEFNVSAIASVASALGEPPTLVTPAPKAQ